MVGRAGSSNEDEFREYLDRIAQQQYSAERQDNHERAANLRTELSDDQQPVGFGTGRYVVALPDEAYDGGKYEAYVVKLALPSEEADGRDGKAQNRREAEVWKETESEYLVPVTAAHPEGYWVVMPRGESVTADDSTLEQWMAEVSSELDDVVWEEDLDPRNVVVLDGEFRLCDYGMEPY